MYGSLNGNICVSSNGNHIGIYATNNLAKLKDSEWFSEEVYVLFDSTKNIYYVSSKANTSELYNSTTPSVEKRVRRIWP
ncbi:hypothetical protein J6Y73_05925 [bacterium]|nr:hypothetical protein [bacterium]